jgi:hypothetical protein
MKAVGIGAFAVLLLASADKQLYYGRHVDIGADDDQRNPSRVVSRD